MRDFTFNTYTKLLLALKNQDSHFQTFSQYMIDPSHNAVILRHDIDYRKNSAWELANIMHHLGINGTFYFRVVNDVLNESLVKKLYALGHEIGYHYEDLTLAKGDTKKAIALFEKHLNKVRSIVPVDTICMHGSPLSKHDNRDLWRVYKYTDYGIIGEPYLDIDFNRLLYLSDTGGMWDGFKYSIRDKMDSILDLRFHTTYDIINYLNSAKLKHPVMFNFHPNRWTDNLYDWMKQRYFQKVKNSVKYLMRKTAQ